ncbi:hypothetical protein LTR27_011249 [Elasticomyces elasticus]|nr:hypothetical protein LTR27_011249 [Elasticomyces elasticus]
MSGNKSGLIGIVASGVGMATEYREHRKYQKQQKLSRENSHDVEETPAAGPSNSRSPDGLPPYAEASNGSNGRVLATGGPVQDDKKVALSQYESDDSLSVEEDEEDWELDEMLPSYDDSETNNRTTDQLAQDVMLNSRAATAVPRERKPLPLPVVIPQRRPRNKARGFVRAYAPVMADSGIDQATFLSFLDNFHKSSQASPIFGIICLSCAIAGMAPSVIAMAVTTAVSLAAQAGAEVQQRQRTNSFLEKMNEELFKPAGLYAFIMKYKPDEKDTNQWSKVFEIRGEKVDLSTNQIIAKYATSSSEQSNGSGMSERMRDLRVASGKTRGALALPEAAELIFPDIDNAVARNGAEETFKDKTKDAKLFLADYLDRRAHVQQALDDPNSTLTIPKEQRSFRSKLADPSHPIYQGKAGIQSMVMGGKTDARRPEIEHRADRRNRINEHRGLMSQQRLGGGLQLGQRQQGRVDQGRSSGGRGGLGGFGGLGGGLGGGRGGNGGGLLGLVGSAVTAISDRGNKSSTSAVSNNARSQDTFDDRYERDDNAKNSQTGGAAAYQNSNGRNQQRSQQSPLSAVKRIMRQDVLYLMIVNMPSEAEMAEARVELERTKSH